MQRCLSPQAPCGARSYRYALSHWGEAKCVVPAAALSNMAGQNAPQLQRMLTA